MDFALVADQESPALSVAGLYGPCRATRGLNPPLEGKRLAPSFRGVRKPLSFGFVSPLTGGPGDSMLVGIRAPYAKLPNHVPMRGKHVGGRPCVFQCAQRLLYLVPHGGERSELQPLIFDETRRSVF
jgi:hypothetical protein